MRFEHPHILWLLPVLPTLVGVFLWWSHRTKQRLLTRFIQARLLPDLTVGFSPARRRARTLLFSTSMALLIVALARPQWGFTWEEAHQKGLDIVVAIDTSKSMLAEDIKPSRLERAKLAALDLMQEARADRLGVVAFAGGAFLQCPLTLDDAAFRQCINELDINIIPQGGTALAEAIRVATQGFEKDDNFKVLVLFTDGEDHDPGALDAAREASESGMHIFTVGLGTAEGEILRLRDANGKLEYVRDSEGQVVKSRLNETILQQIAGAAQGFYLPLRGADTIDTLYEKGLAPLPKSESEARLFQRYHEQYHWPLGLAILLLMINTVMPERRRVRGPASPPTPAAVAVLAFALPLLLQSQIWASPGHAARAFHSGDYEEALQEYDRLREERADDARLQYNAGTAAFRLERFQDAADRYGLATGAQDLELQEQAYYNRGNALYRVGEEQPETNAKKEAWEEAIGDYESALKLNGDDEDARFNLEFVRKRLEELNQQQQQQQENQEQQDDQNSDSQEQNQQQQDKQSGQDQSNDQSSNQDESKSQEQDSQQQEQGQSDQQNQQQDQQDGSQDQSGDTEDQSASQEQQSQPEQGSNERDETGQDANASSGEPMQPSNLTPDQAAQLLDGLKGDEQMLPVRLRTPPPAQPPAKDW